MKKLLLSVMAVATLASCSQESFVEDVNKSEATQLRPITFGGYNTMASAQSRAFTYAESSAVNGLPIASNDGAVTAVNTNLQTAGFVVTAWQSSDTSTPLIGTATVPVGVSYVQGTDEDASKKAWAYANIQYWPFDDSSVRFAAVAPQVDGQRGTIDFASSTSSVAYTVDGSSANQNDLMYALVPDAKYNANGAANGTVTMNFKHALSQVKFKVKTGAENLFVDLNTDAIQLVGLNNKGTFTFNTATAAGTASQGKWSSISNAQTFTLKNTAITSIKNEEQAVGTQLMLIPQEINKTINEPSVSTTAPSDKVYAKISCKLYYKDAQNTVHYVVGNANTYGTLYVTLAKVEMAQSKIHTITLELSTNTFLKPIVFATTVAEAWN